MTDIVERLRTDVLWHERRFNNTIANDCRDAADEIERLRAELASAVQAAEQKREPLTDEQILDFVKAAPALNSAEAEWLHVCRAVERACAEKWGVNLSGGE